jgi:L-asparaginase/Glu-tRNA(Gln) amidotransferase subunit D
MSPSDWTDIAAQVRHLANQGCDKILVLHGTDTASYTAAALSFLLADQRIPIVLTGSNIPPGESDSDAQHNIDHALTALTRLGPGIYLSFAGCPEGTSYVHLGTAVRKVLASSQAFFSINRVPVGKILDDRRSGSFQPSPDFRRRGWVDRNLLQGVPTPIASDDFESRVFSFSIYPGCDLEMLYETLALRNYRGVVLQLYPSGTGPAVEDQESATSLPRFITQCTERGIVVVGTVPVGPSLKTNHYQSTVALIKAGAVLNRYVTPETALVKLMWLLARSEDLNWIKEMMNRSIAGEIPESASIELFHQDFA